MSSAAANPLVRLAVERARPVISEALARGYARSGAYYTVQGFTSRKAASDGRVALLTAAELLGHRCICTETWDILSTGDGTFHLRFQLGQGAIGHSSSRKTDLLPKP